MIKVLIVDDEPYIRQGLRILINWEQYGFEVCDEASNGKEALELLMKNKYDLVVTDIKMPVMSGIELIEHTWAQVSDQIRFIILSGFYEFEYAKKAIKFGVVDYVLKPVQKEELVRVLNDYKVQYLKQKEDKQKLEYSEKYIFDRSIASLISGKFEATVLADVERYLYSTHDIRYIGIEFDPAHADFAVLSSEEKLKARNQLYDRLKEFLGDHWYHAYLDQNPSEASYGVGFIYVKGFAEAEGINEKSYIQKLYNAISQHLPYRMILYIGQKCENISRIAESYKSMTIAKTFQMFSGEKDIAYFDELVTTMGTKKYTIDKEMMDELIQAIERNDKEEINRMIDAIYGHFREMASDPGIIQLNMNYLLFNLLNIAKNLSDDYDQTEVYNMIHQGGYERIAVRGSANHFKKFALEFSDYLSQLRHHVFGGVLSEVEKEIVNNYMDNLSLKSLSEKYYINSAYLGQMFKKHYGIPFKDYLNNYRIEKAAELLIRSDEKIYHIANAVGFNNTDYFISKFVQVKGITPLQYRKQFIK